MKIWKKAAWILLLVCMVLPAALSCSKEPEEPETEDVKQIVLFDPAGKDACSIVCPENGSGRIGDCAEQINRTMQEKYGKTLEIRSDLVKEGEEIPSGVCEILVGETNRAESTEAKKALGDAPYIIKSFENGKVAIIGADDVMTASAVHYFVSNLPAPAEDGKVVLAPDYVFTAEVYDQPVSRYSDGTYRIRFARMPLVYGKDSEYTFMEGFAKAYAARASLPCASDAEESQADYEILLGKCRADAFAGSPNELLFRNFYVAVKDNKISIDAVSVYGFEAAFHYLDNALKAGYADIPAEGLLVEYDYGDTQLGKLMKNYENPYVEGAWPVAVAHRGDFASIARFPENSLKGYNSCIKHNVDIIETDLHQTKDGHWVICHDASLRRTTAGNAAYTVRDISAITLDKLKTLTLKQGLGGDGAHATDEKMPTLEEIIALGKDKVMYNVDKTTMLEMFKPVYEVFERNNAVDSAMFKSGESAEVIANWFAELIEADRKLPLFAPMIYTSDEQKIPVLKSFKGMTSMTETHANLPSSPMLEEILQTAKETNIRLMVLTIDSMPDGDTTWRSHLEKGMTGIMTNHALDFVKLHQQK